jgi:hypothetical protein
MLERRIRTLAVTGITIMAAALVTLNTTGASAAVTAHTQPAQASHFVAHQIPDTTVVGTYALEDAYGAFVAPTNSDAPFSVSTDVAIGITVSELGIVNSPVGWPFSDHRFDGLYAGDPVFTLEQDGYGDGCMQTDSVHSGVVDKPCGAHNAGTYWADVPAGPRGECTDGAIWLVNVGITNHYDPYPYGSALFANTNNLLYTQSHRPIGVDDQWCFV